MSFNTSNHLSVSMYGMLSYSLSKIFGIPGILLVKFCSRMKFRLNPGNRSKDAGCPESDPQKQNGWHGNSV